MVYYFNKNCVGANFTASNPSNVAISSAVLGSKYAIIGNGILDASSPPVLQFNPVVSTTTIQVSACDGTSASAGPACSSMDTGTIASSRAKVVNWWAQVAFKLSTAAQYHAANFQKLTGADCVGDLANSLVTCSSTANQYLVWKRPLVIAYLRNPSGLSDSMKLLQQFNQLYTHDSYLEYAYPNSAITGSYPINYLNCPARG